MRSRNRKAATTLRLRRLFSLKGGFEPGFISFVPFLLVLRYLIVGAVVLRFVVHKADYASNMHQWYTMVVTMVLLVTSALIVTYITAKPLLRTSRKIQTAVVVADITLISVLYILTNNPESDFFLFYYLPVVTAAEYLTPGWLIASFGAVSVAFGIALTVQHAPPSRPTPAGFGLLSRVFVPRELFFFSVVGASSWLLLLERKQRSIAARRESELSRLLAFKVRLDEVFDPDDVLRLTLDEAKTMLHADAAEAAMMGRDNSFVFVEASTPSGLASDSSWRAAASRPASEVAKTKLSYRAGQSRSSLVPSSYCLLGVPIMAYNILMGVLIVGRIDGEFSQEDETLLLTLAGYAASATERDRVLGGLKSINEATPSALMLDQQLDAVLTEVTEKLGFEFATVSLIDDYHECVETVRGKNIPAGWIRRSRHSLDSNDIQCFVVKTGRTEVISGWDEKNRLDKEIFDRFGHAELARVFAPLIADRRIIGTIEAGCNRRDEAEVITPNVVQAVQELGTTKGSVISRLRPHILLKTIAEKAMDVIGADSASLHVVKMREEDKSLTDGLGDEILVAWAGKASKRFLQAFRPRVGGIGHQAMNTRTCVCLDSPDELARSNKGLYDAGIRAMIAFPLVLGEGLNGVLYLHFWGQEHRVSQAELQLEAAFVQQMEVTIQKHLLASTAAELAAAAWAISGFQNVIQSLASSQLELTRMLEDVAQNVLHILDATNVTLYQYFRDTNAVTYPPVMKGSFLNPEMMGTEVRPRDTPRRMIERGQSSFVPDVTKDTDLSGPGPNGQIRFVEREQIKSCAALILRATGDDEILGVMFVNYRQPAHFFAEEQRTINALAATAAVAIKTARLREQVTRNLRRREREIEALHAVDLAIVRSVPAPDVQGVLQLVLDNIKEITGAAAGAVMWFDSSASVLELKAQRGLSELNPPERLAVGEGIIGRAAEKRQPILIADLNAQAVSDGNRSLLPTSRSVLAVPLLEVETDLLGVVCVESPEPGAFTDDDRVLVETLAVQVVIAVHSIQLNERLATRVQHLFSLNTVTTRIQRLQDEDYDVDCALRLLLTGVTADQGLRFSRCMFFEIGRDGNRLRGRLAVGPRSRSEAEDIWRSLREMEKTRLTNKESQFSFVLDQAVVGAEPSPLTRAVRLIDVNKSQLSGALAIAVCEGRVARVGFDEDDPLRQFASLAEPDDLKQSFVCVPLVGSRSTVLGVIVADNRYLESERELIRDEDIGSLEAYAGLMAMFMESATLRARLADDRKLAYWAEFTKFAGHQISNHVGPALALISQLACDLRSAGLDQTVAGQLLAPLRSQITAMQKSLREAQRFVALPMPELPLRDAGKHTHHPVISLRKLVDDLIQEARSFLWSLECTIDLQVASSCELDPLSVRADHHSLKEALTEIVHNASHMMQKSTRPRRIVITVETEVHENQQEFVKVSFTDTGPGVPTTLREWIFRLGFTLREEGTGLGLPYVRNTVESYGGSVKAEGESGEGAVFVVRLPLVYGRIADRRREIDDGKVTDSVSCG